MSWPMRSEVGDNPNKGASIILIIKCYQYPALDLPDVRHRFSISSAAIDIRREWDEPIELVMADPRLVLGRRQ